MKVLRSMLFVPGNSMRMIHKAKTLNADAIIFDLEDAVTMADKETARMFIKDSLHMIKESGADTYVRVNSLATDLYLEDLDAVIRKDLDGIMMPKAESAEDVRKLEKHLLRMEAKRGLNKGSIAILPLIESAKGVHYAYEIASASKRTVAIAFGAADFSRDMGRAYALLSKDQTELLYARSRIAVAARVANVLSIDTPFLGLLVDKEGLVREARQALQLGFKGKLLIHPTQIEPINEVFSPSPKEIDYARRVVEAFKEAEARGLGAISFEGRMIDYATYRQSQELLSIAETIEKKKSMRGK
jgi:citrate lyase subunit beta/citryl-CoA lyase